MWVLGMVHVIYFSPTFATSLAIECDAGHGMLKNYLVSLLGFGNDM